MDWNDEYLAIPAEQDWWHATVSFPGDAGVSPKAAAILAAGLTDQRFHFVRKEGKLRLRADRPAASVRHNCAGQLRSVIITSICRS